MSNIKDKLIDAHNTWPYTHENPSMLYAEALNKIVVLEAALNLAKDMFIAKDILLPKTFEVIDEALAT